MDAFTLVANLELQAESFFSGLNSAGDALLEFAASCVETGMEFDAGMSKVQAVALSTVTVTDQQIQSLSESAKNMGISFSEGADNAATAFNILRGAALNAGLNTVFTAKEASDALVYMGMAGWNAEEMLQGLPGVLNLAAASGTDLGRTSDIVTDALTAFGMQAKDAVYFADLLAETSARANTNVEMMGQTFKYIAPVMGAYGMSAEDAALTTGLLANRGIKASQAGTSTRRILQNIASNTGQKTDSKGNIISNGALDYVQMLGVDFYQNGEMRDWSDFIADLRKAWNDPKNWEGGAEQKAAYAKGIAGQTGLTAFLALMSASDEEFNALQEALASCWYTAESLAEAFEKNGKSLETMRASMSKLGVTEEQFNQALNESHRNAETFIESLARLSGKSADEVKKAMKEMGLTTKDLQKIFDETAGSAQTMADIMLDNLQGDITLLNDAFDGLKIAIADKLTPTLRRYSQLARDSLTELSVAVREGNFDEIASSISRFFEKGGEMLQSDLPTWREAGTKLITALSDGIKSVSGKDGPLSQTIELVGDMIGQFLSENAETIMTTMSTIVTGLTPGIVAAIQGIGAGIKEAWPSVKQALGDVLADFGVFNQGVVSSLLPDINFLGFDLRGTVDTWMQELGKWFGQGGQTGNAAPEAGTAENGSDNIFLQTLDEVWQSLTGDTSKPSQALANLGKALLGLGTNGVNENVIELSGTFDDGISEPAKKATDSLNKLIEIAEKDIESFSWHDDQTSAAATTALDSLLALTPYDDYLTFSQSVFKNGTSGPVEKALWSLMQMLGWDGVSFDTKSVHFDNASEALKEILSLLEQAKAKDGQETHTKSTHENITINRTINQGEANKASKGQQEVLNATAMHGGRILRGATIFGTDANGRNMVGGEVGPEAIVGVNSLDQMIQASVSRAMNAVLGRLDRIINGRGENIQVVLDTGVLVGELVGGMDSEMNRRAAWRGGGRA